MSIYIYILIMAVTTYLIRALPLTVFHKQIKSRFVRSFLAYVPCACLAAMTFPAIFYSDNYTVISGIAALAVALITSLLNRSLVTVAACSCVAVFVTEIIVKFFV